MKRAASLFLVLALIAAVALVSCGPGAEPEPPVPPEGPPTAPSAPASPPPSPTPALPVEEGESPTATSLPSDEPAASPMPEEPAAPLEISSSAFEPGGEIPVQYSCHGANLSPPLEWSGVPDGTQSLALVVDDPDSEPPGFVHWVVYGIPPTSSGLPEGVPAEATLPDGTLQGPNDFARFVAEGQTFPGGAPINRVGYDGPCPGATHRYVFTLYALDAVLDLEAESTMGDVLQAMDGHVLSEAELTGVYTPPQ
jgi:Raf kinase inhibitor-like YbhB/YbcL family protein